MTEARLMPPWVLILLVALMGYDYVRGLGPLGQFLVAALAVICIPALIRMLRTPKRQRQASGGAAASDPYYGSDANSNSQGSYGGYNSTPSAGSSDL